MRLLSKKGRILLLKRWLVKAHDNPAYAQEKQITLWMRELEALTAEVVIPDRLVPGHTNTDD